MKRKLLKVILDIERANASKQLASMNTSTGNGASKIRQ